MPLYFAKISTDAPDAPVKIGYTTAPADEKRIHRRFHHLRIRGEWFHFDPAMLGDLGLADLPCPPPVEPTLRGGPMPQKHREAISAGIKRSYAHGSLSRLRMQASAA